jgi:hypothetical protein
MDNKAIYYFLNLRNGSLGQYSQPDEEYNHETFLWQSPGTSISRSSLSQTPSNFLEPNCMFIPPPKPKAVDTSSTKVCTAARQGESLDQDSSAKKRRMLDFKSIQQRPPSLRTTYRNKYRQMLFPALGTHCNEVPGVNRVLISPCSSLLTRTLSDVGITTRQWATPIITNLLSEKYKPVFQRVGRQTFWRMRSQPLTVSLCP